MKDTMFTVGGYELDRFIDAEVIQKDTSLEGVVVNDAFVNQSGLVSYYGSIAAKAMAQTAKTKLTRDAILARVSQTYRDEAAAEGKKITEKALEELVSKDTTAIRIRKAYIEAQAIEDECKAALEAIKHRRDMLIQIGANQREEMKGDARLKSSFSKRVEATKANF